jgi:hypothetical protein
MDRTVVGPFPLRGEEAARKFMIAPVISDTLAAPSLAITGFVSAGTSSFVLL